jgi:hypothetical protein
MQHSANVKTRRLGRTVIWLLVAALLLTVVTAYKYLHKGEDFPDAFYTDMMSGAV